MEEINIKQEQNQELNKENINYNFDTQNLIKEQNPPEVSSKTTSEPITIDNTEANITNCLALTIQKEHKLVAIKNVFLKSIKISWKVIVSTVALTILKLLS